MLHLKLLVYHQIYEISNSIQITLLWYLFMNKNIYECIFKIK